MNEPDRTSAAVENLKWRDVFSEAIRFWERMRPACCTVLALVVLAQFLLAWPASAVKLELDLFILTLFLLAVLANALYTLAFVPDVFVQLSEFRGGWSRGAGACSPSGRPSRPPLRGSSRWGCSAAMARSGRRAAHG